jgi:tRNA-dihydrouridine synthase A
MITTGAIIHGKQYERLKYSDAEHPLALQLGGNNANEFSICASIAEQFGYDEINLNIGCPSDRVKNGAFGACLMAEPERVADCVAGIKTRVSLPVTVKTRTGIDDMDSYEHLYRFIDIVATAGCRTFIVHARKALLKGLSPRQNREIPPLNYEMVHRIKEDFPQLEIIINGGITTFDQGLDQLNKVDGVMIGRVVCNNPYILAEADKIFFNDDASPQSRTDILKKYMDYIDTQLEDGYPLPQLSRHILGLFQGQPGARLWRRYLSENIYNRDSGLEVIEDAFHFIRAA